MKVNFNKPFKNIQGEDMMFEGKPQLIKDVVAQSLFTGDAIEKTGNSGRDNTNKMISFNLCNRIYNSEADVEISTEEATLVKQAVSSLNAAGYAQVVLLIEGDV